MPLLPQMRPLLAGLLLTALFASAASAQTVFINEFHYDNDGADTGEFVEVAGPAGLDLENWKIELYNGSNGARYDIIFLTGAVDFEENGVGAVSFPRSGIQQGPDGLALISPGGDVVQFLSYEGSFTATDGTAVGLTSTDVGVSESGGTPVGQSLQLIGSGNVASDFTWSGPGSESPGSLNGMQDIDSTPGPVVTTTSDASAPDGQCSLREAIDKTNGNGSDSDCLGNSQSMRTAGRRGTVIQFDIPESDLGYNRVAEVNQTPGGKSRGDENEPGVWTIETSGLPALLNGSITIDGFSQPGAFSYSSFEEFATASVLRIEIKGVINNDDRIIPPPGLITLSSSDNVVQGLVMNECGRACIAITPPDPRRIASLGSSDSEDQNVEENIITGNFLGVRPDGVSTPDELDAGSTDYGILISGSQLRMMPPSGDIERHSSPVGDISYNSVGGIPYQIIANDSPTKSSWTVRGRSEYDYSPNVIGGARDAGVRSEGPSAYDNGVFLNIIGLGADGTTSVPNGVGVQVADASELAILLNVIDDNDGKGIDLGPRQPEAANERHSLQGGNLEAAVITLSNPTPNSVDYLIEGQSDTDYIISVFINEPDGDATEGQFLFALGGGETNDEGEASGTIDFEGDQLFDDTVPEGFFITATATAPGQPRDMTRSRGGDEPFSSGQTSEFSNAVEVGEDNGTVSFAAVQQAVNEEIGTVDLVVTVEGDPQVASEVTVTLVSGDPADLGGFTSETVPIEPSVGTFTVTVPVTDDAFVEDTETFVFELSTDGEDGGLSVGSPSQTAVLVVDNDGEAVVVTVPPADGDGDGVEDGGPRLFSLPIDGVTASDIAEAAGGGPVFRSEPGAGPGGAPGFVEAEDGYVFMAGEPVLAAVAPGAELTFSGSAPDDVVAYPVASLDLDGGTTGGDDGADRALFAVGNPTGEPLDLDDIEVAGGTLADVALVFDTASGAFRPVQIGGGPLTLGSFEVVVLQVVPDDGACDGDVCSGVAVSAATSGSTGTGDLVGDEPFTPSDGETAVVLALRPSDPDGATAQLIVDAASPGDTFALRLLAGATAGPDASDAVDLESPGGAVLASPGPLGTEARLAAESRRALAVGESVTVPLVVAVPQAGTYEIALANAPGSVDGRPVVVEVFDGTTPTVVVDGAPFVFDAGEDMVGPDGVEGRFSVRVSVISNVATEGDPTLAALAVYPNPTAGRATVTLSGMAGAVRVAVYDVLGREVARLHEGAVAVGAEWPVARLAPGVYVVRAEGSDGVHVRPLTVVR